MTSAAVQPRSRTRARTRKSWSVNPSLASTSTRATSARSIAPKTHQRAAPFHVLLAATRSSDAGGVDEGKDTGSVSTRMSIESLVVPAPPRRRPFFAEETIEKRALSDIRTPGEGDAQGRIRLRGRLFFRLGQRGH